MKNSLIARIVGVPVIDVFNDLNFYLPELDYRIFLNDVHNLEHNHKCCCRISKALFKLVNHEVIVRIYNRPVLGSFRVYISSSIEKRQLHVWADCGHGKVDIPVKALFKLNSVLDAQHDRHYWLTFFCLK